MNKLIVNFKSKDSKKIKDPKNFLGGKGSNLSEMGRMGLPVPPIPLEALTRYGAIRLTN